MTKKNAVIKNTRAGLGHRSLVLVLTSVSVLALAACGTSSNYAPVVYHHKGAATGGAPVLSMGDRASEVTRAPRTLAPVGSRYRKVESQSLEMVSTASRPAPQYVESQVYAEPITTSQPMVVAHHERVPEGINRPYEITVQPGDTLYSLARAHGVEREDIADYNDLYAPYNLRVGQVVLIPKGQIDYFVRPGDTLYGIARSTGTDVRALAMLNSLDGSSTLSIGQQLRLPPQYVGDTMLASNGALNPTGGPYIAINKAAARHNRTTPPASKRPSTVKPIALVVPKPLPQQPKAQPSRKATIGRSEFVWPVSGRIISSFGPKEAGRRNDGLNISVPAGTMVRAARAGEVIYTGNELKGYGNLVLVRHDGGYVSAYAHNARLLVKRGDYVRQGQHIADSGQTGSVSEPQVHFEIRKNKKPINPISYLPRV